MSKFDNTVKRHRFLVSYSAQSANGNITMGHKIFAGSTREVNNSDIGAALDDIATSVANQYKIATDRNSVVITSIFYMGEMTDAEFNEEPKGEE